MMSKNGFSRCGELYIGRLRKEGRHSTAQSTRTPSFLSASSAAYLICRSGKSPVSVYGATGSILMNVV